MDIRKRIQDIKGLLAKKANGLDPEIKEKIQELCKLCEELHNQASFDFLTGLYNRRFFEKELEINVERAIRERSVFSLILMDLDHFKRVNDKYGHLTGDEVLKGVAALIKRNIRKIDIPARYGGEEFAIILPGTSSEGALSAANRLKQELASLRFGPKKNPFSITASMGVATYRPRSNISAHEFLQEVDRLLYRAKESGRNKIVTDDEKVLWQNELEGLSFEEREALKGVWSYDD